MSVNTIEPSPVSETSDHGRVSFALGRIPPGGSHLLFMQFQVNPTNVGHRAASVWLYDGPTEIAQIRHSITIFP